MSKFFFNALYFFIIITLSAGSYAQDSLFKKNPAKFIAQKRKVNYIPPVAVYPVNNLAAYQVDSTRVSFSYQAPIGNYSLFYIYRSVGLNNFSIIDSTTNLFYTDSTVEQQTLYSYKLQTRNGIALSGFSQILEVTTTATIVPESNDSTSVPGVHSYFARIPQTAHGVAYYFSTTGNNANDGLSPQTPKRDFSGLSAGWWQDLNPSDSILFKRGDVWDVPTFGWLTISLDTEQSFGGAPEGRLIFGAYGNVNLAKPKIPQFRTYAGMNHITFQDLDLDWVYLYIMTYTCLDGGAGGCTNIDGLDQSQYPIVTYTRKFELYDLRFTRIDYHGIMYFAGINKPSQVPYDNKNRAEMGKVTKVEIDNCTYRGDGTGTTFGDAFNFGMIGDSLWFRNNDVRNVNEDGLDIGSGNFHIIENCYFVYCGVCGVKYHSQYSYAGYSEIRGNVFVKCGNDNGGTSGTGLALENVDHTRSYNNTYFTDWVDLLGNRPREQPEQYYGDYTNNEDFNNIKIGATTTQGWENPITYTGYYDQVGTHFVWVNYNKIQKYSPLALNDGQAFFDSNYVGYNTHFEATNYPSLSTTWYYLGRYYIENDALNLSGSDFVTRYLNKGDGNTYVRNPLFVDPNPVNFNNFGNYALQPTSPEIGSGRPIPSSGYSTNYYWKYDITGKLVNGALPDRGALQYTVGIEADTLILPSNFIANLVADKNVALTWNDNSLGEDSYHVMKSTDNVNFSAINLAENSTSYLDQATNYSTQYWYKVKVKKGNDSLTTAVQTITTNAQGVAPSAPSNIVLTLTDSNDVRIVWDDNSNNESVFRIYQNGTKIDSVSSNVEIYNRLNLSYNTSYIFGVSAKNNYGVSAVISDTIITGEAPTVVADTSIWNYTSDFLYAYDKDSSVTHSLVTASDGYVSTIANLGDSTDIVMKATDESFPTFWKSKGMFFDGTNEPQRDMRIVHTNNTNVVAVSNTLGFTCIVVVDSFYSAGVPVAQYSTSGKRIFNIDENSATLQAVPTSYNAVYNIDFPSITGSGVKVVGLTWTPNQKVVSCVDGVVDSSSGTLESVSLVDTEIRVGERSDGFLHFYGYIKAVFILRKGMTKVELRQAVNDLKLRFN